MQSSDTDASVFIEHPKELGSAVWVASGTPWEGGKIWLGRNRAGEAIGCRDDRHMVTIAGSRAGKGVSSIIPNLALWPGSCLVLDPKGENAQKTAAYRATMPGHKVVVIDPFNVSGVPDALRGSFNPLDLLDYNSESAIDVVAAISDALIVPGNSNDTHWDESARQVIEGVILHIITSEAGEDTHLSRLRELLTKGDPAAAEGLAAINGGAPGNPFAALWNMMGATQAELPGVASVIEGVAATLESMGDNERGSVLSTARRNTKFLDSPAIGRAFGESTFSLNDLKTREGGLSLYLCLPARFMATHARFLRVVLNLTLFSMETARYRAPDDDPDQPDDIGCTATGHPVLFVLDEFAALGRMEAIEKAAGLMAGYGVKLWPILQDLSQLKRHYRESWESFLGNAGLLQFFGNTDITTLEWLMKRIGETSVELETTGSSESLTQGTGTNQAKSGSTSNGTSTMAPLQAVSSRDTGGGMMSLVGRSRASTISTSETSQTGETVGSNASTSTGTTDSINRTIQARPLARIDELARYFDRETGLQVVFIGGGQPLPLKRTPYYVEGETEFSPLRAHIAGMAAAAP